MNWFRKLFESKPVVPSYGQALDEPDPIDWNQIESLLLQATGGFLEAFASKYATKIFYGLAFDCEPQSGEILIHLNTREGQASAARQTHGNPMFQSGRTEAEISRDQEWDVGTWKYHAVNFASPQWKRAWRDVQRQMDNANNLLLNSGSHSRLKALNEEFMVTACKAVSRLDELEGYSRLQKEAGFRRLCLGRQETTDVSQARLARVSAR